MDLIAHFMVGLLFYRKFGSLVYIFLACAFDLDHVIGYFYDRRKKLRIELPPLLHLAYRPRSWLHSFTGLLLFSFLFSPFFPAHLVVTSLFSHLLLDMVDKSGVFIFPPLIKEKVRGILPVGYFLEDPKYLKRHKRSHIPSLVLTLIVGLLVFFGF